MGKRTSTKRLSSISQSASKSVDIKARKRIGELFELTDEIINAYNEVNEKYVNQIYRKYKQLQEVNKTLQRKINRHHCTGCKCTITSNDNEDEEEEEEEEEEAEESENSTEEEDNERRKNTTLPSSTTDSIITRSKTKNPFIISDIEDTQNFDENDSRFNKNTSDDDDDEEEDRTYMDTSDNPRKATKNNNNNNNESEQGSDEDEMAVLWSWAGQGEPIIPTSSSGAPAHGNDVTPKDAQAALSSGSRPNEDQRMVVFDETNDEDNGLARLPLTLQNIIKRKANKNRSAKSYLLQIPRYPALCEFLRDKSRTSFDQRPSENQVRPLIADHLSQQLANDAKIRMRVRDELRELHRSYMRTFMNDPHGATTKSSVQKNKQLTVKKSPM